MCLDEGWAVNTPLVICKSILGEGLGVCKKEEKNLFKIQKRIKKVGLHGELYRGNRWWEGSS